MENFAAGNYGSAKTLQLKREQVQAISEGKHVFGNIKPIIALVNCSACNKIMQSAAFTNYPIICTECKDDLEEIKRRIGVGGVEAFRKWWGEIK